MATLSVIFLKCSLMLRNLFFLHNFAIIIIINIDILDFFRNLKECDKSNKKCTKNRSLYVINEHFEEILRSKVAIIAGSLQGRERLLFL